MVFVKSEEMGEEEILFVVHSGVHLRVHVIFNRYERRGILR